MSLTATLDLRLVDRRECRFFLTSKNWLWQGLDSRSWQTTFFTRRAEVVNGLWNALQARGLASTVGILADESSSLGSAVNEYSSWLPQVINKVAALVHHTYDFPSDSSYTNYVSNVRNQFPGKLSWMSVCKIHYMLFLSHRQFSRKFAALLVTPMDLGKVGPEDMIPRMQLLQFAMI